jgi:hypothetical protein
MEDELVDQIASRFGRQALIIENSTAFKKECNVVTPRAPATFEEEYMYMVDEP